MQECNYCQKRFDKETELVHHLESAHDFDELSRIDQKRVESYQAQNKWLSGGVPSMINSVSRRRAIGFGGGVLALGGIGLTVNRWFSSEPINVEDLQGQWSIGSNLPYQAEYPAVTTYNGELYVFGGAEEGNIPQSYAYKYSPENETWSELTPMPVEGQRITASRLGSKVYIIDGRTQNHTFGDGSVRIYDIEADSWSLGSTRPVTTRDAGQSTDGERIYMFGGNLGGTNTDFAHAYDPGSDSWQELSSLPFENRQMSCHYVPSCDLIYMFGGESPDDGPERDEVITYDPGSDSYDSSPTNMPEPSQTIPSTVHKGKVLFPGGEEPGGTTGSRSFWVYDPEVDRWGELPTLINMVEATDSAVIGNKLFVPGGRTYFEPGADLDEEPHTFRYNDYPVFHDRMQVYRFNS